VGAGECETSIPRTVPFEVLIWCKDLVEFALILLENDRRHFMCKGASSVWMSVRHVHTCFKKFHRFFIGRLRTLNGAVLRMREPCTGPKSS